MDSVQGRQVCQEVSGAGNKMLKLNETTDER